MHAMPSNAAICRLLPRRAREVAQSCTLPHRRIAFGMPQYFPIAIDLAGTSPLPVRPFLGAPASDPASPALAVSYSRAAQAPRKPGFRQMPPCAACSHAAPGSLRSRTAFGLFSEIRPPTPDICSAFPAPGSTLGALRAALRRHVPLAPTPRAVAEAPSLERRPPARRPTPIGPSRSEAPQPPNIAKCRLLQRRLLRRNPKLR